MRIPIVNEKDEIIGHTDRHNRKTGSITRITSLWLGNEKGEVLLAQRALTKERDPGKWGPAVAGTLEEGETYESNIIKEAEEEIGLKGIELKPWNKIRRKTSHDYFVQSFIAFIDSNYPFKKDDEEVEAIKWFTKDELFKLLDWEPEIFLTSVRGRAEEFFKYENQS